QIKIDQATNKSKLQQKPIQQYQQKLNSLQQQSHYYNHIQAFLTQNNFFFKNIHSYQQLYNNISQLNQKITHLKNQQNEINLNLQH
ncbi:hypothetical protein, partial [Staphylococcus pettenkoferi]|uniref:hypothetical protein n=1 Tax=Staphylococcus pettenkoferi TaxID=170573 RepID=UPI001C92F8FB